MSNNNRSSQLEAHDDGQHSSADVHQKHKLRVELFFMWNIKQQM